MRAAVVYMCLKFFFTNTYCCFRCPSRFSVGCTYLCASVFIRLFCIVYEHCTSMSVQNVSAAAQQNPGIPVGRG